MRIVWWPPFWWIYVLFCLFVCILFCFVFVSWIKESIFQLYMFVHLCRVEGIIVIYEWLNIIYLMLTLLDKIKTYCCLLVLVHLYHDINNFITDWPILRFIPLFRSPIIHLDRYHVITIMKWRQVGFNLIKIQHIGKKTGARSRSQITVLS